MSKVTMKDIAARAGVAQQTVSKIINKKDDHMVSRATRERVEQLVREMDYHPDYLARSLRSGKRFCIGFAGCGRFVELSDPALARIQAGIGAVVDTHDYYITVIPMGDEDFRYRVMKAAASKMVDGIIMMVYANQYDTFKNEILPVLHEEGVPIVTIQTSDRPLDCDNVGLNMEQCGYLAANHLVERGYREIGIIADPVRYSQAQLIAGYTDALAKAGLRPDIIVPPGQRMGYRQNQGREIAADLVRNKKVKEAYVVYSDAVAGGMTTAFREHGLAVPGDVALAGTDDILDDRFVSSITSVSRQYEARGRKAAELLFKSIDNKEKRMAGYEHIVLEPELVVRETTFKR